MLYIHSNHEKIVYCIWGKWVIKQWEQSKNITSTIWGADWDYYSAANHIIITLNSSPCCIQELLIVTNIS